MHLTHKNNYIPYRDTAYLENMESQGMSGDFIGSQENCGLPIREVIKNT